MNSPDTLDTAKAEEAALDTAADRLAHAYAALDAVAAGGGPDLNIEATIRASLTQLFEGDGEADLSSLGEIANALGNASKAAQALCALAGLDVEAAKAEA